MVDILKIYFCAFCVRFVKPIFPKIQFRKITIYMNRCAINKPLWFEGLIWDLIKNTNTRFIRKRKLKRRIYGNITKLWCRQRT